MAHPSTRLLLASFGLLVPIAGCSESHMTAQTDGGTMGQDAPFFAPDAPLFDAPFPILDTGVTSSCAAEDAHAAICPAALCDGPDSYAWDGERCVRIDCGACQGSDCASLAHSQAECEARHPTCAPAQCRATGGDWLFWAEECHHYRCGNPQPAECLIGMPVCNCGEHRSFDAARGGCFDDATCPEVDPLPPMQLCAATGGTWTAGICCNTHCGEYCPLACASDACVCGPMQVFDAVRGCIESTECFVRTSGQECGANTRCQDGLICCQHCGGAGCDPHMTCEAPTCDADPNIDECGNDLLAP